MLVSSAAGEAQVAATKLAALLACERQLRDRNSQLEAPGADFTPLLALIDQADKRMASKHPGSSGKVSRMVVGGPDLDQSACWGQG